MAVIGMNFREVKATGNVGALPRRMPGRARGQLILFDEHAISPAKFGQMIEQTRPHNPAADDDNSRLCFHDERLPLLPMRHAS